MHEGDDASSPVLSACCSLEFDLKSSGIDFEPFQEIWNADHSRAWLREWAGGADHDESSDTFRIFGRDRSGGCAALWIRNPSLSLDEQPIVCFESEGKSHLVAQNAKNFLWLLASGVGPLEAVRSLRPDYEAKPHRKAHKAALRLAGDAKKSARDIVLSASGLLLTDFSAVVDQMSKRNKKAKLL